jgi:hypothetical protein
MEARQLVECGERSALVQQVRLPELPFKEHDVAGAISAHAILASAKRPAAVKDVVLLGIEVQAADAVLIFKRAAAVGVGREIRSSPVPDSAG